MKKAIAVLWLMVLCGSAWGASYPELGACTGTNVRLREDPGTDGRIIGKVEDRRHVFVLLGEEWVDGQKWYEIEHPTQKGTAYISARYVNDGWYYNKPTGRDFVKIRQTFGIFPEKAQALFGRAKRDNFGHLNYNGLILRYDDEDMLHQVQIEKRGYALAGIQVGDNLARLYDLDMSEDARSVLEDVIHDFNDIAAGEHNDDDDEPVDGPEGWTYINPDTSEEIFFEFGTNSKGETIINMMTWTSPQGEG